MTKLKSTRTLPVILFLLACSWPAHASTTVIVDKNEQVTVTQSAGYVAQAVVTPVVVTREVTAGDFEGRVVEIDYALYQMFVRDIDSKDRQIAVRQEMINNYRVGDYVLIRPTTDFTVITLAENPKDFEGEIIRVDIPKNQIVVQDTTGRERKVQMKQGMIGTYKVDDYVRVHLMADLKEAKTIETVGEARNLEGRILSVDAASSRIVIRGNDGSDSTVILRQGQANNYHVGDNVRVYLLANHEQVQVIRVIR